MGVLELFLGRVGVVPVEEVLVVEDFPHASVSRGLLFKALLSGLGREFALQKSNLFVEVDEVVPEFGCGVEEFLEVLAVHLWISTGLLLLLDFVKYLLEILERLLCSSLKFCMMFLRERVTIW